MHQASNALHFSASRQRVKLTCNANRTGAATAITPDRGRVRAPAVRGRGTGGIVWPLRYHMAPPLQMLTHQVFRPATTAVGRSCIEPGGQATPRRYLAVAPYGRNRPQRGGPANSGLKPKAAGATPIWLIE
jgi:hypothetical protein